MLLVQDYHLATGAVEKHEGHQVERFHLDIQLDQDGQAVDGFAEVDGLGIEINLLHLGIGTHHGDELQRETRTQHPLTASYGQVGFMEHLMKHTPSK